MIIGGTTINTPIDNPVQYDPDWRSSFAAALIDHPDDVTGDYKLLTDDIWVKRQVKYLEHKRNNKKPTIESRMFNLAATWYQGSRSGDVKYRIEPLLLTDASFEVIAMDIGGGMVPPEVFQIYERLYFSVREPDGTASKSCQLRQYFAAPDYKHDERPEPEQLWKLVAAQRGYDALVGMWGWTKQAHGRDDTSDDFMSKELWSAATSQLFTSIFSDKIGYEPLAKILSAVTAQTRMLKETGGTAAGLDEQEQAILSILGYTKPTIIGAATAAADSKLDNELIKRRVESQLAITKQKVEDKGGKAGEAAVNKRIKAAFSEKIR